MRQEQRAIADVGAVGIIRESFKLLWIYPKSLLLHHLVLILVFHSWVHPWSFVNMVWGPIIRTPLLSLNFYSIGLIYAGRPISYREVMHAASLPSSLGLGLTTLYYSLLKYLLVAIQSSPFIPIRSDHPFIILLAVILKIPEIYLDVIFTLASGESVLEEVYGCAAFVRGHELLQGKTRVLLPLCVTWFPVYIAKFLAEEGRQTIGMRISMAISLLVAALAKSVIYVSCKAFRNESIEDSRVFNVDERI